MADDKATLENLKQLVAKFNTERKWEIYHQPKELAIAIAVESAELLDIFKWQHGQAVTAKVENYRKIKEEMADILILLLSLANTLNIDLSDALVSKIEKNAMKYPGGVDYSRIWNQEKNKNTPL
ncbi:MAG: nucleotide pyrophosphohydrolase [Thermoplasmata archaeon]|nr:nucleotide pyrophosphohydrolase [Thermoplasmata archaeon]